MGKIKLNVNASMHMVTTCISVRGVFDDHEGYVLRAWAKRLPVC